MEAEYILYSTHAWSNSSNQLYSFMLLMLMLVDQLMELIQYAFWIFIMQSMWNFVNFLHASFLI